MAIFVNGEQFHLCSKHTSYILGIYQNKYPLHYYWGDRLSDDVDLRYVPTEPVADRAAGIHHVVAPRTFLTDLSMEFSVQGEGLFRSPTLHARYADGSTVSDFSYQGYRIFEGKKPLAGLPSVYTEAGDNVQTLELHLKDGYQGLSAYLCYTVFEDYDVITRSIRYENDSSAPIELLCALSATVDFYAPNYQLLHLSGDWMREGNVERTPLDHMRICLESNRGSSSAMAQPFAALLESKATESQGKVYGFSLVYSGSFRIDAERDSVGQTRINLGISPFDFCWKLDAGEHFQAPEVVMVYSDAGIGRMSRRFHRLYRQRLCRGKYRDALRPMVINHWDATGTEFTQQQLMDIAKAGVQMGLEQFVMDDGWYGDSRPGHRPLGDWTVNKQKLPDGLNQLARVINDGNMRFGLWFEPEIVSPESCLYKTHPGWCMSAPGKESTQMHHQLILDLSMPDVQNYLIDSISEILDSANISYVKWDYNRCIIETPNQMQRHKYILGLYYVLETITQKYPNVLFESCSSGGGRFDPGMLYYMPQTWTSDMQQAMARLKIQHGLSIVYPPVTMTAHAGQIEYGHPGYNQALNTSAMVSMAANFGFEMDISRLSKEEREQSEQYVALYKEIRPTIQFGDFYRLSSPFTEDNVAWQFVDEKQAVLFTYQKTTQMCAEQWRVCLQGLDPNANYETNGKIYSAEVLMKLGFRVLLGAYHNQSHCFIFKKI